MRLTWLFAALNLLCATLIALGVFAGLPDRWLPVDLPALLLIVLLAATSVALFLRAPWAVKLAHATAAGALGIGLVLVALLALAASYLRGIYGPVGQGGALIYVLLLALVVPYLIVLPLAQLLWLRRSTP